GGAFDADAMLLNGMGGINGDLVIGGVAAFDGQIVIFDRQVEIGVDELVLDRLPDDPGHLIAVEVHDGVGDFDLAHRKYLPEIRILGLSASFACPYSIVERKRKDRVSKGPCRKELLGRKRADE